MLIEYFHLLAAAEQLSAKMDRGRKRLSVSLGFGTHKSIAHHDSVDLEECVSFSSMWGVDIIIYCFLRAADDPQSWIVHLGKRPTADFYDRLVQVLRIKEDTWLEVH